MNLFILDRNPVQAARFNCDAHVRKIILESIEMMGYAYDKNTSKPWNWIRIAGHVNHPMSLWVRDTRQNFDWTLRYAYGLCEEFYYRFGKIHKCLEYIDWISANIPIKNLRDHELMDWPRCFGDYKEIIEPSNDAVYDYRRYYMLGKRHLAFWKKREIPEWYR